MNFAIYSSHEALHPFIHNYWHLEATAVDDGTQRIMSNGRVALQFYPAQPVSFGDDDRRFTCCLNVHGLGYFDLKNRRGKLEIVGAEFTPYGARMFFNVPMSHCTGMHLTPDDLNDREFAEFEERVLGAADMKECCLLMDEFFLKRLLKGFADELNLHRLQSVFRLAESREVSFENSLTPTSLADEACLSPKQFTRIFHEFVGLHPKAYLRLLRCHAAVLALQNKRPEQTLTEIAWHCGYYDLSHMAAEFTQIHGTTPSTILSIIQQRRPHPVLSQAFQPVFSHVTKKLIRSENLI